MFPERVQLLLSQILLLPVLPKSLNLLQLLIDGLLLLRDCLCFCALLLMDWLYCLLLVDLLLHLLNLQLPLTESLLDLSLKNVVHDLFFHLVIVLFA